MKTSPSPPMILGLDTSSRALGLAVVRGTALIASVERIDPHHAASDQLAPLLQELLRAARVTLAECDGFAISIGPGSFTGLRVGVAFVKALAMATGTPVVKVSTLEALAANAAGSAATICPILDAKQQRVHAALFVSRGGRLVRRRPDRLTTWEAACSRLRSPTLFLGDGVAVYGRQLRQALGRRALCAPEELWYPRAATVARLGAARFARGVRDDARELVPNYQFPRDCTIRMRPARRAAVAC
ncbi:MAG: tRNA (adenosine(37)-N6)-threonylcarbamoyltransferase complex dimerization subunit type 1 TsaB [Candidatus Omnitrophica bacterium]|nr:tRNA (adenosine(37)-N6)-threonylcarbamoyltransferase complex dimerization subunit type 1 TsaB [Candidatus Omnitrophota bacterium]